PHQRLRPFALLRTERGDDLLPREHVHRLMQRLGLERTMYNQWVIQRALLGSVYLRNRAGIRRICAQAIHRLRWERDQPTRPDDSGSGPDSGIGACGNTPGGKMKILGFQFNPPKLDDLALQYRTSVL